MDMRYKYLVFDLDDTLNNDDENRKIRLCLLNKIGFYFI